MIPLSHRQKGPGPHLSAKGPHQRGPFGEWPDVDGGQDGEQHEAWSPPDLEETSNPE